MNPDGGKFIFFFRMAVTFCAVCLIFSAVHFVFDIDHLTQEFDLDFMIQEFDAGHYVSCLLSLSSIDHLYFFIYHPAFDVRDLILSPAFDLQAFNLQRRGPISCVHTDKMGFPMLSKHVNYQIRIY